MAQCILCGILGKESSQENSGAVKGGIIFFTISHIVNHDIEKELAKERIGTDERIGCMLGDVAKPSNGVHLANIRRRKHFIQLGGSTSGPLLSTSSPEESKEGISKSVFLACLVEDNHPHRPTKYNQIKSCGEVLAHLPKDFSSESIFVDVGQEVAKDINEHRLRKERRVKSGKMPEAFFGGKAIDVSE